jgi:dynein intermediate chain
MTDNEFTEQMKRKDFNEFLNKTSRIVERALDHEFDVAGDFFKEEDDDPSKMLASKRDKITQAFVFQPNKQIKRSVTSIDWSPKVGELLLVSYSKCTEHRYDEPDGMVCIYSMSLKSRPEIILHCQNEVTKAIFNPFQPNVVIGCTQSGYIVQWNIKEKKTPVQRSTLAKDGHNQPIHSLAIIGSQNAHNIVSISVDGKMCLWDFGELSNPKISFFLFD